jgi:hypothetical protein
VGFRRRDRVPLVVTVIYGAIAGILALRGRSQVEEASPPVPEQARLLGRFTRRR